MITELYLNAADGSFTITDIDNKKYTTNEAKALFESGQVEDYNLALKRLISFDWDLDELKRFYKDNT